MIIICLSIHYIYLKMGFIELANLSNYQLIMNYFVLTKLKTAVLHLIYKTQISPAQEPYIVTLQHMTVTLAIIFLVGLQLTQLLAQKMENGNTLKIVQVSVILKLTLKKHIVIEENK